MKLAPAEWIAGLPRESSRRCGPSWLWNRMSPSSVRPPDRRRGSTARRPRGRRSARRPTVRETPGACRRPRPRPGARGGRRNRPPPTASLDPSFTTLVLPPARRPPRRPRVSRLQPGPATPPLGSIGRQPPRSGRQGHRPSHALPDGRELSGIPARGRRRTCGPQDPTARRQLGGPPCSRRRSATSSGRVRSPSRAMPCGPAPRAGRSRGCRARREGTAGRHPRRRTAPG